MPGTSPQNTSSFTLAMKALILFSVLIPAVAQDVPVHRDDGDSMSLQSLVVSMFALAFAYCTLRQPDAERVMGREAAALGIEGRARIEELPGGGMRLVMEEPRPAPLAPDLVARMNAALRDIEQQPGFVARLRDNSAGADPSVAPENAGFSPS